MPTLLNIIQETAQQSGAVNGDVITKLASDTNYIKKSSVLVAEALKKGSDVMQLAGGHIVITEVKTVTYKYSWNNEKGRFERANAGHRVKRPRKNAKAS